MLVKNFMLPLEKVVTVQPDETVAVLLDKMIEHDYHAVVVTESDLHVPVGIVTKADMILAYQLGFDPKTHKVREVMSTTIETVLDTDSRDAAAKHFEETKHKNAFVVNKDNRFEGMLSVLDIAVECARDDHAWPWNREALAQKYQIPSFPKCAIKGPVVKPDDDLPLHTFVQISGMGEL